MADEEEIVVTLEPEADVQKTNGDDKAAEVVKAPAAQDPVAELTSQYKELQAKAEKNEVERRRAEKIAQDAKREAEEARKAALEARTEVTDSQINTITAGLAAAESDAASAEGEYARAMQDADYTAAARAQRKMAAAEANIARLKEAKEDIESRKKDPEPDARGRVQDDDADPFENFLKNRTEATASWLRAHKDWVIDPKKNAKLTAAHYDAVGNDLTPDTEAYFEHVETFLGLKKAPEAAAKPAQRRSSAPVAPVTATAGGTSGNGSEVTLTLGEARAATDGTHVWNYDDKSPQKRFKKGDPIGVQEFARRKKAMQEQGLYDRVYVEQ